MKNEAQPEILALIPAQCGSKSIPSQNLHSAGNRPLLVSSIEHAVQSRRVSRVVVCTDSEQYAETARAHGAEVPFLFPDGFARGRSTDLEIFRQTLRWFARHEGYVPDICVHLRPTCPVRDPAMIDRMVDVLEARPELDSVRSVVRAVHSPLTMGTRNMDDTREPWNDRRQQVPESFLQTANVNVVRRRVILEQHSLTGGRFHGHLEYGFHNINSVEALNRVSHGLGVSQGELSPDRPTQAETDQHAFCFAIDGVITTATRGHDYWRVWPRPQVVRVIRRLYKAGHRILLFTARGSKTGTDWRDLTESQMHQWGVPYHDLLFGRPAANHVVGERVESHQNRDRVTVPVAPAPA